MSDKFAIDKVFKALADRKRREVFHLLMTAASALSLSQLATHFEISRQGITKHIGVLKDAGLVDLRNEGRNRMCLANMEPLEEVRTWLQVYDKFWDQKLDDLSGFLDT